MAKRKRLSPAQPTYLSTAPESKSALGGPGTLSAPPIAQVASEAASEGALQELTAVLETARAKGLMIEEIPLSAIDETHLVRDRLEQDEEEMGALVGSLRSRGQQTPIEVVQLGAEAAGGKTHGLISGWRRLTAMRRLFAETNDPAFATVKALVIHPDGAEGAYVAMVEENEIRVNLSHYERARIAVRALREGVYSSQKYALQSLFANATRAKRSKIGSFVTLVEALDEDLLFPTAIREKLGLGLVRAFAQDPGFATEVVTALRATPRSGPEEEQALLSQLLAVHDGAVEQASVPDEAGTPAPTPQTSTPDPAPAPRVRSLDPADSIGADERVSLQAAAGVRLGFTPGQQRIELTGTAVDSTLMEDLKAWLRSR
ncbi:ParB/RepB/Spo0J family partition protein [Phaeobacter sp. C3_T13_0]|uniref:ParB/RepB/Spo0J family partition protein n=1 Tax=Phaeobacter cretensis TaxID=3342641 RepID=UPI0039BD1A1D